MQKKKVQLPDLRQEEKFHLLRAIYANPNLTQREMSELMGASLGKTNSCVRELRKRGWLKTRRILNSQRKIVFEYSLTSEGLKQKLALTRKFMRAREMEYQSLEREVRELLADAEENSQDRK